MPERLYILDSNGKVLYKGGIGPDDYHPEEVDSFLQQY